MLSRLAAHCGGQTEGVGDCAVDSGDDVNVTAVGGGSDTGGGIGGGDDSGLSRRWRQENLDSIKSPLMEVRVLEALIANSRG